MKTYQDFKTAVGQRESSGNYLAKNVFGYLGKYQFGMARLYDFGLADRKDKSSSGLANSNFVWKPPMTESKFLSSPKLQEVVFDLHVRDLSQWCQFHYSSKFGKKVLGDIKVSLSGCIAVCHLLGRGGLMNLLDKGMDGTDGNKTKASSYMKLFCDYKISEDLITRAEFEVKNYLV